MCLQGEEVTRFLGLVGVGHSLQFLSQYLFKGIQIVRFGARKMSPEPQ